MKTRFGYVSNSSSSSYIVAYDKSFFGDLPGVLNDGGFGFETSARDLAGDDWKHVLEEFWFGEEDGKRLEADMKAASEAGGALMVLSIDHDCTGAVKLLKHINDVNGGNKMKILWGEEE